MSSLSPYELAGITEYLNENCKHNFVDVYYLNHETGKQQYSHKECEYCGFSKIKLADIMHKLEDIEQT